MSKLQNVTVKKTGESLEVYRLWDGDYYDWKGMSEADPPTAAQAGKKKFKKEELIFK